MFRSLAKVSHLVSKYNNESLLPNVVGHVTINAASKCIFSNFQRPVQSTHPTLDVHILVLSDKYQILQ